MYSETNSLPEDSGGFFFSQENRLIMKISCRKNNQNQQSTDDLINRIFFSLTYVD